MAWNHPIWIGLVFGLIGAGVAWTGYGTLLYYARWPLLVVSVLLVLPELFRRNPLRFAASSDRIWRW